MLEALNIKEDNTITLMVNLQGDGTLKKIQDDYL
jgi:hypothetical protein